MEKKKCPKCGSENVIKHTKTKKGTLRFKCKECSKVFSEESIDEKRPLKRRAIILYLLGDKYATIAKKLEQDKGTIRNWLIKKDLTLDQLRVEKEEEQKIEVEALKRILNMWDV